MKKVLLASTAVAAFIAFSGAAQAQDPGRADFGATEGGGGAGSAFTVTTKGAVKFYLKYATGDDAPVINAAAAAVDVPGDDASADDLAAYDVALAAAIVTGANDGFFALVSGELEINGAATTDSGIDIDTHVDFSFAGSNSDSTETIGGSDSAVAVGRIAIIDELSMKISGGFGSVELGSNDGAEDVLAIKGSSVAAGTGGIDGDHHTVSGGVGTGRGNTAGGGSAGSGDSSDALKATYLSPVFAGVQGGVSIAYSTAGPNDFDGGVLGVGVGAKYSGSAGGLNYGASLVWGDTALTTGIANTGTDPDPTVDGYGAVGIGLSLGGAGASFATGVTIEALGAEAVDGVTLTPIVWSGGVAYNIADVANVSLTADLAFVTGSAVSDDDGLSNVVVFVSADYAVLPGVTLALDLGYGDSAPHAANASSGFTGVLRTKAAF